MEPSSGATAIARNLPSSYLTIEDIEEAIELLKERPQFDYPDLRYVRRGRRILVFGEHEDIIVTPGTATAANGSWTIRLVNSKLDRASRLIKRAMRPAVTATSRRGGAQ